MSGDSSIIKSEPIIGIDLGTTFSAIAHLDSSGRPETIPNAQGDRLTPSAVLVDGDELIVGREAVRGAALSPGSYAECFKRDLGSRFYHRPINGVNTPPEVLSGLVLQQLKRDAEQRLGLIRRVVITVPAFFDETRRRATQDAGRLAGLDVLDIINEPTAAALAIGRQQGFFTPTQPTMGEGPQRLLIYDLGGGTFDVTILEVDGVNFRALATAGDVRLGGKDFDQRLVEYVAERFHDAHGVDPRCDPQDAAQLWQDAQEAKHALSQRSRAALSCMYAGIRMKMEITRQQFEEITADLLYRTESTSAQVVREAGMTWQEIDRVLLVGGSTRMPMVPAMLERLTGQPPDRSASPDEAVAHGAAIYAAMLMKTPGASGRLINVNSHSLGVVGIDVATRSRLNCIVIPKNTALPHRVVRSFVTDRDGQRSVRVPIVEGESRRPDECIPLGECVVRNLPPGLPKGTKIQVEFAYGSNGRIAVAASVPSARQSASVAISRQHDLGLEDLETWERRLKGEPEPTPEEKADSLDHGAALERLDELYTIIGQAAVSEELPEKLVPYQEAAAEALERIGPCQAQLAAAQKALRSAAAGAEAMHAEAAVARAKTDHEQRRNEADFALVILGRECVAAKATPDDALFHLEEIHELQQRLHS